MSTREKIRLIARTPYIKEVKLKDFQYKILNRTRMKNVFFYKFKRKETD